MTKTTSADYVVVGAGAAGSVVAARLSERADRTVVLVEAGGRNDERRFRVPAEAPALWQPPVARETRTVPQGSVRGRVVPMVTGLGLGGGSAINAMTWLQGHPADYDGWVAAGAEGWGWSEVLPLLRAVEDHELGAGPHHGGSGPMAVTSVRDLDPLAAAFIRAGTARGWPFSPDLDGDQRTGIGVAAVTVRDGARHSVVDGYLGPASGRGNLRVLTRSAVTRVLFEGRRAVGVQVRGEPGAGATEVLAVRGVVLCAGALRTPQLLMVSGVGPGDHLAAHDIGLVAEVAAVGSGLQDHPAVPVPYRSTAQRPPAPVGPADLYELARRGPLAAFNQVTGLLAVGSRASDPAAEPDIVLGVGVPVPDGDAGSSPGLCFTGLVSPESRGTVRLASVDPDDDPVVDPRYLSAPADRPRLREGLRMTLDLFRDPTLSREVEPLTGDAGASPAGLDDYIDGTLTTYFHPVGTVAMGSGPAAAAGADLRVLRTEHLWVGDASAMPRITRGHTQAPTIVIAERAARSIAASGGRDGDPGPAGERRR